MGKLKRNERIAAMMKILGDHPNKIYTLNYFTERFQSAKSTISEDLVIVKQAMEKMSLGRIETIAGAAGGVKFIPQTNKSQNKELLMEMSTMLMDPDRILPGGFLYMADIIYWPSIIQNLGVIFASQFSHKSVDYIVTVETKGIPLAMMVAKALNLPLVILRSDSKVTEGSTVSISYVSGSSGKIQQMSLAKRAIKPNSKVIFIDDFMKAGGTAKGVMDMMREFDVTVEGIGVLISTKGPENKLVENYTSLLILDEVNERDGIIDIYPNPKLI
ncbi:pur operon repressor [Alkaliphilus serpentinus]|uniref:Pur operon repressor n=1 Tax=Alkaliphilus serpentinus TaxID=1482731 RepID=A0A833HQJ2_9FIRM|nr:pur operon repressor [Alkaliphilus serpentinus]KAB3531842.1 pur operon repressor [Alkaliphilus serpentinus]